MAVKDLAAGTSPAAGVWKPFGWLFRGRVESRIRELLQKIVANVTVSSKYYSVARRRRRDHTSSAKCRAVWLSREYGNRVFRVAGEFRGGMCHGLGITILFHRALIIWPAIAILCGNVGGVRSKRGSWLSVNTFMLKETRSGDQTTTATIDLHGNSRFAQLTIHRCLFLLWSPRKIENFDTRRLRARSSSSSIISSH